MAKGIYKTIGLSTPLVLAIIFFGLLILTSGCVSTSKYKALQAQLDEAMEEKSQLNARVKQLDQKIIVQEEIHTIDILRKDEQKQAMQEMVDELEEEINSKLVKISMLEDTLTVEVVEKVFFDSGSASVKPNGRQILAKIAPTLKNSKGHKIKVVGRADELPPSAKLRGKYPSNWELSTARATSVIQILQWGLGIDPKRMIAAGVAHYRPVEVEGKENLRAANRVVKILLIPSKKDINTTKD